MCLMFYKLVILSCAICLTRGNQCIMEGVENWLLAVTVNIMDTDRQVEIFRRATENIEAITSVTQGEALNKGPYLTMSLVDSNFVISTNEAFSTYENDETSLTIGSVVQFRCTSGSTSMLVITVSITDTNNHSPEFLTPIYEFTIAPPVPPGFLVTDCINDVIARDVDLTTYMIDFEIEGSDLFEITYDESSTEPKNFKAILRTATFIRTIPEPIVLRIRATDVDRTGDEPRTVDSTITIKGNSEFEFPDEPIFSQAYYLATYTETNQLELTDTIRLRQGFDDQVTFSFDGDLKQYFELDYSNNVISFKVLSAIPIEEYPENGQIYLVVSAERLYTSGAMATIIVQFPRDDSTENRMAFDHVLYLGQFQENVLTHEAITVLNHDGSPVLLSGSYSQLFEATIDSTGVVTVARIASEIVPEDAISINLEMTVGAAKAVLIVNVIPPDDPPESITAFDKVLYIGQLQNNDVTHEAITLIHHDESPVLLFGSYAEFFGATITNGMVTVVRTSLEAIPDDITSIPLEMRAGAASAVLVLNIIRSDGPSENTVAFDKVLYIGQLQDNDVTHETITVLHHDGSPVLLSGSYAHFLEATIANGLVTVVWTSLETIPDDITSIPLEMRAGAASAVLVLNIIRSDGPSENTVAFDKVLYIGQLQDNDVTHETITVLHHDGSPVLLSGSYAHFLEATIANGLVTVVWTSLETIPDDITSIPLEMRAGAASAVLVLNVIRSDGPSENTAAFDKVLYIGQLQDNIVTHETITVLHHDGSPVLLSGSYAHFFEATIANGLVTVVWTSLETIPDDITGIPLEMRAGAASAVLVLNVISSDGPSENRAAFDKVLYIGQLQENIVTHEKITVLHHDGSPVLLSGSYAQLFEATISNGVVTVVWPSLETIPEDITSIPLEMRAGTATAVLLLNIIRSDGPSENIAAFHKVLFIGQLQDNIVIHEEITILHHDGSPVLLSGSYSQLFEATISNGVVTVAWASLETVPEDITSIPLEMRAGAASAVLVLHVIRSDGPSGNRAAFDKVLYIGQLQENVVTHEAITVLHHEGSPVLLSGSFAQLFEASILNGVVTVAWTSLETIPEDITSIPLEMRAGTASAVLVLNIIRSDDSSENKAAFDKVLYIGQLQENVVSHEAITVLHHDESPVLLSGSYAEFFEGTITNGMVTVVWSSLEAIPDDITSIPLEMRAGEASAVLVLNIIRSDDPSENKATFDKVLYIGQLQENVVTHETITVLHHDGSPVLLSGSYTQLFEATISNGVVTIVWTSLGTVPADIPSIPLEMRAGTASAVLVLNIIRSDGSTENRATFDKALYIGELHQDLVTHEAITVLHHDGSPVLFSGEYAQLFEASITNGVVTVTPVTSVTISGDITSIPLEIRTGEAVAVLILSVIQSDQPVLPTVSFSSSSYTLRADVSQAGVIGTVHATADNGEPITYALLLENDHLRERLSVNSDGEISLSAPAASGGYNFQVQATAIVNRVSAVAEVSLWIDAVTVCDTDIVLHPLIVIERLEEEPHRDLVILNQEQYAGCEFELTNHWPRDQNWLYVDGEGLHAGVIDREHESIAFMHVSQVQVELVLHCENDSARRKRSLEQSASSDYGSKSWILTESILYNSRRSLVNLIVIDINDNAPIFVGKENEPINVGYPTNELEDTILPRSLVELKATDADIGENAEILYWSADENLAVAPTTGFVHVRQSALLEDNSKFTIHATDQNGRGLDGSIDIVVKLLDQDHIAVVTINDAFLDDEPSIIKDISTALGYDVKILKAAVVSTDTSADTMTRKKRETDNMAGSLQLYVYGIEEDNPVPVNQLTSDISNSDLIAVNIARVLSLEDHLLQICPLPARETALLAATISLAVLLFLIITIISVREFLKRKKEQTNYEQFSDANSLASRNNSIPVIPKVESLERPRLNMDELRKSEKRLQDMLSDERREPSKKKETEPISESIIDMPVPLTPEPEPQNMPIVIQSIDKLKDSNDDSDGDEYGEVKNNRRKSVVTFNENVEKIIHIEDRSASISSDSTEFEVYKF